MVTGGRGGGGRERAMGHPSNADALGKTIKSIVVPSFAAMTLSRWKPRIRLSF